MAPVFIFLEVVAVREQEEVVSIIFAEHFLWKKKSWERKEVRHSHTGDSS